MAQHRQEDKSEPTTYIEHVGHVTAPDDNPTRDWFEPYKEAK